MTEFNLEKESDDYSRSFNLCVTGQGSINLVSASWYQHSTVGPWIPFKADAWSGSSCDESVNYMNMFHSICGTMTDGGNYLMANYKGHGCSNRAKTLDGQRTTSAWWGNGSSNQKKGHLFKLGTCGIEQIGELPASYWTANNFCGKIKGGAAFCSGNNCVTYSDETGETTLLPNVRFFLSGL